MMMISSFLFFFLLLLLFPFPIVAWSLDYRCTEYERKKGRKGSLSSFLSFFSLSHAFTVLVPFLTFFTHKKRWPEYRPYLKCLNWLRTLNSCSSFLVTFVLCVVVPSSSTSFSPQPQGIIAQARKKKESDTPNVTMWGRCFVCIVEAAVFRITIQYTHVHMQTHPHNS